mmetsp:Transcript_15685/g.25441  ORF Transcript_15685/g.25441 Transcript_15685/m.25441 type:complete len:101 (+) Transcript_15685:424-726(+)
MMACEGSCAIKRPMPSLIDDEVVIDACWSEEKGAIIADDAGDGASITIDKEEVLLRPARGLVKPETCAATDRKDRTNRQKFFMLEYTVAVIVARIEVIGC